MRTNYEVHTFNETCRGIHGYPVPRFGYQQRLLNEVNPVLIANFNKVAEWVETNCPHLNGVFECPHNVYHWTHLKVENGKAYLEHGGHGWGWEIALSRTETAIMATGSMQRNPYAFVGIQFFKNTFLEEFLKSWSAMKTKIIAENNRQESVYSESFTA